jgi:glycosyltransferase involved in cell wall biosynthesis
MSRDADTSLQALYGQHQGKESDKWSLYLSEYDRLFTGHRQLPVRLLEIGVQNGGSLEVWSAYFPNALQIVGCDINPDCARLRYADPRVSVVVGDANTEAVEACIATICPEFDLILDDGSHRSDDIVRSFARYFPRLADGGLFIAEDLHCSYWGTFKGGLYDPTSSMAFFRRLTDVVNHQHWGLAASRRSVLDSFASAYGVEISEAVLSHVHSIEFVNSLCVIRKNAPAANLLGERVISGTDGAIVGRRAELHGSLPVLADERDNPWSTPTQRPEVALARARVELESLQARLDHSASQARLVEDQLRDTRSQNLALTADLELARHVEHQLHEAQAQILALTTDLEHARRLRDAARQQLADRARQLADTQAELQQTLASTSWRLTRPVRWVQDWNRARRAARRTGREAAALPSAAKNGAADYAAWVALYDVIDDDTRGRMRRRIASWPNPPLISVVMPTYNADPTWLREAIDSVRAQAYPHWQLCIADDGSTAPESLAALRGCAVGDARIKTAFRDDNGHISTASNTALTLATGEWIALMDHDDLLPEHALFWIADAIDKHPGVQLIYSDEDKISEAGARSDPYFKPDWNVDLFYSHNMFSHLGAYRAELVRRVGGFQLGMEGAQDYDLVLRCLEHVSADQVHHVPKVLYHWRVHPQSTAGSGDAKPYALMAGERALNEHFRRASIRGRVEPVGIGYRVRYELPPELPLVSLVIPTRNAMELVQQCVDSITERTTYSRYEIILVDNGSDDPEALAYFAAMQAKGALHVIRDDGEFNYSALNNRAVAAARGEVVCLLNNDIEVISPEWLSEMVSIALQPGVGAVGARLWYPSRTLQHGGVVLGVGGVASHAHKGLPEGRHGYFGRAALIQGFSAVTAACMVIRKDRYEAVRGLNEIDLKVAFNDVDFCLRLREAGLRNVWTPYAELVHHESSTRGADLTPEQRKRFVAEVNHMKRRWGDLLLFDPAYNPNLTLLAADFGYAWPPRERADMKLG